MIRNQLHIAISAMTAGILLAGLIQSSNANAVQATYQYSLSRFTGTVPYQWSRLSADPRHQEVYVLNTRNQTVDIYNRHGMEVYSFSVAHEYGAVRDITVDKEGNLYLLTKTFEGSNLLKLDFRGEVIETMSLQDLPTRFADFNPDGIELYEEEFLFADLGRKRVVRTDLSARFLDGYMIDELLVDVPEEDKSDVVMNDFTVDSHGRALFTLPMLWMVGILNPDGTLETFGRRGDGPGKFGIISGVAVDETGLIYVSDILRSLVIVFDHRYEFQMEFGGRGTGVANLVGPNHLALQGDLLYVAQLRERGISVFRTTD